jgi:broad specificity phosphatase PhoE
VLAERLDEVDFDAVYASDLRRARETAEVVARRKGLTVEIVPELREVDVGSWSGLTRAEAEERFPDGFRRWLEGGPGWESGETYEEMAERTGRAVLAIAAEHPRGRVLLVTHGGPIRAVHSFALGLELHAYRRIRPVEPNARLSAVCIEGGRFTELCPASEIDDLLARDQAARAEASRQPPTPAG